MKTKVLTRSTIIKSLRRLDKIQYCVGWTGEVSGARQALGWVLRRNCQDPSKVFKP